MQRKERLEDIGESKYNKGYNEMKEEGVPEYLRKGWRGSRWRRVIRFRMNNEMRGARYWEEEEKRSWRLCGMGEKT